MSRRSFLRRGGAAGAALALPAFAAACANNDETVFGETTPATVVETPAAAPTATPTVAAVVEPPATKVPEQAASTAAPSQDPTPAPEPGPLVIDFTYTMGEGGKPLAPYLAVWIEDIDGTLIRTVDLWVLQDERRGPQWFPDLPKWFQTDQDRITSGGQDIAYSKSSATRAPGSYSVLWDGLDLSGTPAPASVVVCVESARERGPYSLACAQVDRRSMNSPIALADDQELSGVTVALS